MNSFKHILAASAVAILAASPAFAQDAPSAPTTPTAPAASSNPGAQTSGTDSQVQIKDEDVFGYDITMGAANLTPEQLQAAKNTCNQNVTAEPLRYSAAVKSFCTSIQ
ncbi:hypothetical protein OSH10_13765 [Kaistia defluvii]|uniref:hypothetical protein n=1 Tax=Kaistia defluvii TaxID=410841 RepID=UPI00225B156F|nr:hypothetical protein [Kaistia defluvii]MCX5519504.1 hypothetical protein [Kaistia defluvii]